VTIGHPSPEELTAAKAMPPHSNGFGSFRSLDLLDEFVLYPTEIGPGSTIRGPTTIYSGVFVGTGFDCAHNVTIRERCKIGDGCYVKVNTEFRKDVTVGDGATLAGTLGDRSTIGDDVTSFGNLIHKYDRVRRGVAEIGPSLGNGSFVGRGACVIGPVTVGELAYVAAGAIVTKDVPAGSLVIGAAGVVHHDRSPALGPIRRE
jgi:acetyltransferase-like isoleucine patch superfamily enzyme